MPELPEVETMVLGLRKKIMGKKIIDTWADEKKLIHHPSFYVFKRELKGRRFKNIKRRGKIIVSELEPKGFLLFHPKMTGHFLVLEDRNFEDKTIHLMLSLDGGQYLAWSDQRKFSRIEFWLVKKEKNVPWLNEIGINPLSPKLSFDDFNKLMGQRKNRVKSWLMDQRFVAGIGNIYASEILWAAQVNPEKKICDLTISEKNKIFLNMKKILNRAIIKKGTSVGEFRDVEDRKGNYGSFLKVYRKSEQNCQRCGQTIRKKIIGNRSTYYCPNCQK